MRDRRRRLSRTGPGAHAIAAFTGAPSLTATTAAALVPGPLPMQDRLLDLALAECASGATSRPLLHARASAWGTTLIGAAERVRINTLPYRQHALLRSEVHRLQACADVRAARTHADLDVLFARYGLHD